MIIIIIDDNNISPQSKNELRTSHEVGLSTLFFFLDFLIWMLLLRLFCTYILRILELHRVPYNNNILIGLNTNHNLVLLLIQRKRPE